jgi:hypothetical protein
MGYWFFQPDTMCGCLTNVARICLKGQRILLLTSSPRLCDLPKLSTACHQQKFQICFISMCSIRFFDIKNFTVFLSFTKVSLRAVLPIFSCSLHILLVFRALIFGLFLCKLLCFNVHISILILPTFFCEFIVVIRKQQPFFSLFMFEQ